MQYFKTLRTISLILCFTFVFFGCATNKSQFKNINVVLKAEAVSEGICLSFNNIPPETTRLFIILQEYDEPINSTHDITVTQTDIRDSILEQVKNNRRVILPFVKTGQKYDISVVLQKENDFQEVESVWATAECTPYSGIYFDNKINLKLDETRSSVTLSSEPVFSAEVYYSTPRYEISVKIGPGNNTHGIGVGSFKNNISSNILTYYFEPEMTDEIKEGNYLENGDYPAYITAYCNIIYENIKWNVEIAKTSEFTFSL